MVVRITQKTVTHSVNWKSLRHLVLASDRGDSSMLAPCVQMEHLSGTGEMSSFVIPTLFVQISDCVIVVININLPCFITIVIIIYFMFFLQSHYLIFT